MQPLFLSHRSGYRRFTTEVATGPYIGDSTASSVSFFLPISSPDSLEVNTPLPWVLVGLRPFYRALLSRIHRAPVFTGGRHSH